MVRETNGTLREGTWEERDRLCQMYHPKPGRKLWLPTLLTEEQLPNVLKRGLHLHVLDLVCVQCLPDSKDFIRVSYTIPFPLFHSHYSIPNRYTIQYMSTSLIIACFKNFIPLNILAVWCGIYYTHNLVYQD